MGFGNLGRAFGKSFMKRPSFAGYGALQGGLTGAAIGGIGGGAMGTLTGDGTFRGIARGAMQGGFIGGVGGAAVGTMGYNRPGLIGGPGGTTMRTNWRRGMAGQDFLTPPPPTNSAMGGRALTQAQVQLSNISQIKATKNANMTAGAIRTAEATKAAQELTRFQKSMRTGV